MRTLREKSPLAVLNRWRVAFPDDAGIGAAAHRCAQVTSLRSRPGDPRHEDLAGTAMPAWPVVTRIGAGFTGPVLPGR